MKQTLLLLIFGLLMVGNQASAECRRDTVNVYSVAANGSSQSQTGRIVNTYDAKDSLLTKLEQSFQSNVWENQKLTTQTFNASGKLLTKIVQSYNPGANQWVDVSKLEYVYSGINLTEHIEWLWSTSINNWYEDKRWSYTNNTQGKPISVVYKAQTVNTSKANSVYDANSNENETEIQTWTNNAWVNNNKTVRTFDAANRLLSETPQFWNTQTNVYGAGANKVVYTYDSNGNLLQKVTSAFDFQTQQYVEIQSMVNVWGANRITEVQNRQYYGPGIGWKTVNKQLWSYNQQNYLSEKVYQALNPQETYDNTYKEDFDYNTSGLLISFTKSDWMAQMGGYRPAEREEYSYSATNKLTLKVLLRWAQLGGLEPTNEWVYEYNTNDDLIAYEVKSSFNGTLFTVRIREEYSCGQSQTTGIESLPLNTFVVSPNPANQLVRISNVNEGDVVSVVNSLGQEVKQLFATANSLLFDVTSLQNGIYFLVFNNNKVTTKRLVVAH